MSDTDLSLPYDVQEESSSPYCAAPEGCGFSAQPGDTLCVIHVLDRANPEWRKMSQPALGKFCQEIWKETEKPK